MGTISEGRLSRRTLAALSSIFAIACVAVLWMASSARAAELVYWDNYSDSPATVGFANLDGSAGGALNLSGASEFESPEGMAYDPVTNRLFVGNEGGLEGQVTFINLDGSGAGNFTAPGAPIEEPEGVAIDPATRTIYWLNNGATPETVSWARLDGSAGGVLNTTGATLEDAYRIAVDPAGGRVYWGNNLLGSEATVSFANVDNSGGGDLDISGAALPEAIDGIAVDPAGGRVYWMGNSPAEVSFASLSGGSGGDVNTTGAAFNSPYGLALDPSVGRLYWANYGNKTERAGAIGFANVNASGGGGIDIATAPVNGPQDPVIIKSPSGTVAPKATRAKGSRSKLSCSTGGWGADYPGSFVYQSPRSYAYQWKRNGKAVGSATTLNAKSAGKYVCVVTATNQAGSASQASAKVNVKAAKVKLTTKRKAKVNAGGVAKFRVKGVNG